MTALELLRRERAGLIACNSLGDPETHEAIPGTMEAGAVEAVAEYDAAIAEVEGMMADVARLEKACGGLVRRNSGLQGERDAAWNEAIEAAAGKADEEDDLSEEPTQEEQALIDEAGREDPLNLARVSVRLTKKCVADAIRELKR